MARNKLQIKGDLELYQRGEGTSLANIFDLIYPVGSIYMSVNNVNPSTYFGGTWVAWGAGRVPVGIKPNDTLFGKSESIGGSKDAILVNHNHDVESITINNAGSHGHKILYAEGDSAWGYPVSTLSGQYGEYRYNSNGKNPYLGEDGTHSHTASAIISTKGSSGTNANLQPYITCYMWKRTE